MSVAAKEPPEREDAAPGPVHLAEQLLLGGHEARIVLDHEVYVLRRTRAGKLILTK